MTKTLTALTALFFSTAASAGAPLGMDIESILINGDNVRVEYSAKSRDCGVLIDDFGRRVGPAPLCRNGNDLVMSLHMDDIYVKPGSYVQLCAMRNIDNCTDYIRVREAGDVNGDNQFNVADLMLTYNHIMGYKTGSWPQTDLDLLAADINEDGEINVIDILLLIELLDLD